MKLLFVLLICIGLAFAKNVPNSKQSGLGIIGGNEARAGQFPFVAALNVQTLDSKFFCGGALISDEWILTSGHCVNGAVTVTVRLGSTKLTGTDPNRQTLSTSHVVPHPDFNPETSANDIGLLRLRLPVTFTDYIQPITIAQSHLPNMAYPTALGWGQTSDDDSELSTDLQYVTLAVVPNDECALVYGNSKITNDTVCVEGNYNEGTCYGDAGSPLAVRLIGGTELQHVGVSSFFSGNGCETTEPSGYIRTYPHVAWIKNVTGIP